MTHREIFNLEMPIQYIGVFTAIADFKDDFAQFGDKAMHYVNFNFSFEMLIVLVM